MLQRSSSRTGRVAKYRRYSFSAIHVQLQCAVFWEIGVVVQPKDFKPTCGDVALLQLVVSHFAVTLKSLDNRGIHPFDGHDRGVELADEKRLAKSEIVGIEKPFGAVR